jgi:integration host factor subunit alpha
MVMTLTKENLAETIRDVCGATRKDSHILVEKLLEIIKDTLVNGEDVLISGFGKFCVKDKNSRRGRNPATGEDLTIKPRKVVTFKCSGILKDKINRSRNIRAA